jgi:hypothetical protein
MRTTVSQQRRGRWARFSRHDMIFSTLVSSIASSKHHSISLHRGTYICLLNRTCRVLARYTNVSPPAGRVANTPRSGVSCRSADKSGEIHIVTSGTMTSQWAVDLDVNNTWVIGFAKTTRTHSPGCAPSDSSRRMCSHLPAGSPLFYV